MTLSAIITDTIHALHSLPELAACPVAFAKVRCALTCDRHYISGRVGAVDADGLRFKLFWSCAITAAVASVCRGGCLLSSALSSRSFCCRAFVGMLGGMWYFFCSSSGKYVTKRSWSRPPMAPA